MKTQETICRRELLRRGGAGIALFVAGGLVAGCKEKKEEKATVSPLEDLMREHGVLARLLLVYDDIAEKLAGKKTISLDIVKSAATVIRNFVEEYHNKLEEEYVFPRFLKNSVMNETIGVLLDQHRAGRAATDRIMAMTSNLKEIPPALRGYTRMFRAHAAWEESVVYPAFRGIVTGKEYRDMGELFEKREQQLFGANGFAGVVNEVSSLEKALDIGELSRYTLKEKE